MAWFACFMLLGLGAVVGIVVNVSRLCLARRTKGEMRALLAVPRSGVPAGVTGVLPALAARYRELAVGDRVPVRTLEVRHAGTFRTSPTAKALPIHGQQLFTADPPGFVWSAHIALAPGVWLNARDMAAAGKGSMRVLLEATVPVVDASGSEIDQGSALRLLAEMVWYPTALFDARYVTWSALDETHARATLTFGDREVSGVFEFGTDGLPVGMSAKRFMDQRGLEPWGGTYRDWRSVSGMRVPFEATVTWQLDSGPYDYAHWLIESLVYDGAEPLGVRLD